MKLKKQTMTIAILSAITTMGSASVYASENHFALEEVIVTAQKRAQSSQDVGMAITATGGETLKDMGVTNPADLSMVTPGLTFSDAGSGAPVYSLRGVGFYDTAAQAAATVGVYLDETAIPYPVMTKGAMFDVERVEVLKGPQGTLYGLNTTGGAIKYIANKPAEEFEAGVTLGYGSYDTADVEGYLSGNLADDLDARLSYKTTHSSEGWQESTTRDDDRGVVDRSAARLQLNWRVSNDLEVLTTLSWWEDRSDTQTPTGLDWEFQRPSNTDVVNAKQSIVDLVTGENAEDTDWDPSRDYSLDEEYTSAAVTLNWDLSDSLSLTSVSSYQEFDRFSHHAEQSGPVSLSDRLVDTDIKGFSQELRLSGSTENIEWVTGIYYYSDNVDDGFYNFFPLASNTVLAYAVPTHPLNLYSLLTKSEVESTAKSAFAHAEWQFSDTWKATVGLRYTDDEKEFVGCTLDNNDHLLDPALMPLNNASTWINTLIYGGASVVQPGQCATLTSSGLPGNHTELLAEDNLSGRIGLDWTPNQDWLVYGNISRGFKAGGFPTQAALWSSQFESVVAEELLAYELGFKADFLDGTAQLNSAIYYYDYENKQLQGNVISPLGILAQLRNVPESTVKGADMEVKWLPLEGLYLSMAASYIDSEVTKYTDINEVGAMTDFKGSTFPYNPKYQLTFLSEYQWSINDQLGAFVGMDISYTDDTFGAFQETDKRFAIDSYTLLNARGGVESQDGRWRVMLWAKNLTDDFYVNNVYKSGDQVVRFSGKPVTYGVSLDINF